MEYTVINAKYFQPLKWSGGKTTELYIFPPTSTYQQRNFSFRLSTATVETDKSEFTSLCGISRKLMVLEGKTTLNHEGHYIKQLNKFDVDEFEGDWKTSSIGKCTDFNLMTIGKTKGELAAMVLEKTQSVNYYKDNCNWIFMYVYVGKVSIGLNNKICTITNGDLLVVNKSTIIKFDIKGIENSELVFAEIIQL